MFNPIESIVKVLNSVFVFLYENFEHELGLRHEAFFPCVELDEIGFDFLEVQFEEVGVFLHVVLEFEAIFDDLGDFRGTGFGLLWVGEFVFLNGLVEFIEPEGFGFGVDELFEVGGLDRTYAHLVMLTNLLLNRLFRTPGTSKRFVFEIHEAKL